MDVSLSLVVFLALTVLTALSGGVFKPGRWYREELPKPPWTPPDWLFPVAWTPIYAMIAVSGWLVWEAGQGAELVVAMVVYGIQLSLNFLWSAVFFGLRRPGLGLIDLILLWLSIAALIWLFFPIRPLAAWLLVPYLAWVSFAGLLNADIVRRQRVGAVKA